MLQQFSDKNKDLIVSINGLLVHRDKAAISPFDSAVQGAMLFGKDCAFTTTGFFACASTSIACVTPL